MKNIFEGATMYQEPRRENKMILVEHVMEDVAKDLGVILEKLKRNIDAHEYGVVLGVDGGGRVPGLMLGKALKTIYQRDGVMPPKTTFLAGSRASLRSEGREAALAEYFSLPLFQGIKENGQKILLVEDVIKTGESFQDIVATLDAAGLPYTIATISSRRHMPRKSDVVFANTTTTLINQNRTMSGVHKSPEALFSQTLRRPLAGSEVGNVAPSEAISEVALATADVVLQRTRKLVAAHAEVLAEHFLQDRETL